MLHYLLGGKLCNNQQFQDKNPELIDMIILKLIYKKRIRKPFMKNLFCSLCNQVVIIQTMAPHALPKCRFAKIILDL